ncbi:hypothetical protein KS4_23480 [Poriferisphaera corsica]|uniref:Uncharacterized protein n=1 Tax=Poriferisphaera corsica TaxID=2528020 RepID=A0A517YVM3_9BACT|nr:hypothetical protein [Poriferisphaera corsica]QDU34281.1 hypothetical protein KS4_23480 [Poriferisphaera corsica]
MTDTAKMVLHNKWLPWLAAIIGFCGFFYTLGGRDISQAERVLENSEDIRLLQDTKADRTELEKAVKALSESNMRLDTKTEKLAEIYVILAEVKQGVSSNSQRTDRIENKLDRFMMAYPARKEGR